MKHNKIIFSKITLYYVILCFYHQCLDHFHRFFVKNLVVKIWTWEESNNKIYSENKSLYVKLFNFVNHIIAFNTVFLRNRLYENVYSISDQETIENNILKFILKNHEEIYMRIHADNHRSNIESNNDDDLKLIFKNEFSTLHKCQTEFEFNYRLFILYDILYTFDPPPTDLFRVFWKYISVQTQNNKNRILSNLFKNSDLIINRNIIDQYFPIQLTNIIFSYDTCHNINKILENFEMIF